MINHVRTIILNEADNKAGSSSGFPYAEVIDPDFASFKAQGALLSFQTNIYPAGLSIKDKLEYTAGLIRLIHQPMFNPFITYFDSRITYNFDNDNFNAMTFDIDSAISRLNLSSTKSDVIGALFKNSTKNAQLSDMYKLWAAGVSKPHRLITALLAYVFQCSEALK